MLAYYIAFDFGYGWFWNYSHLYLAVLVGGFLALLWRKLNWWVRVPLLALAAWGFAGFLIVQIAFRFNRPQLMPTEHFLAASSSAKVLDIGSGSGRTTVMVLLARPATHVTALDNFSADYIENNGPDRLKQNVRAASLDAGRVEVVAADMRKMPMGDASYDAAVSSYAIDHLDRQGIPAALHETARVLRPGGEFLLSIIAMDPWLKFTYGPLLMHARRTRSTFWDDQLRAAGFTVVETGRQPGSHWYLCRKP